MTTPEIASKLVELCTRGEYLAAIDSLYSKDIVSVEAIAMPPAPAEMRGIDAVRGKSVWWMENHIVHSSSIDGPFVKGDQFIVNFKIDITFKKTNQRSQMSEAGLYTVANGKIVREEFFYSPK